MAIITTPVPESGNSAAAAAGFQSQVLLKKQLRQTIGDDKNITSGLGGGGGRAVGDQRDVKITRQLHLDYPFSLGN